jgi:hypothetical protein
LESAKVGDFKVRNLMITLHGHHCHGASCGWGGHTKDGGTGPCAQSPPRKTTIEEMDLEQLAELKEHLALATAAVTARTNALQKPAAKGGKKGKTSKE